MHRKNIKKSKLKSYISKKFILSSLITIYLIPIKIISQPLIIKFDEINKSNKSFITEAVEKTGSAVVIETQKILKSEFRNSKLF